MRASVVIPAHNEEKNISATIRALLAQDHPDFEIIVVNNASTDRTAEIARGFPVKVVHESRKGLLWARERGRLEATGDIVVNIDADCLPDEDWLSRGTAHFLDDEVAAVSGPYDYYDGTPSFRYISRFAQRNVYYLMNLFVQLPMIRGGAVMIGGNNFIRRAVIEKMRGYNTDLTFYGEDTDTAKRVSRHGRVIFSRSLMMKTSSRRFKDEGTLKLSIKYLFYFFKHLLMKPGRPQS